MKRKAWKYAAAFLGIMLFFTFFSRTLYNATLPRAIWSQVRSGYIQQDVNAQEGAYLAADGEAALPVALPGGLEATVDRVAVQCGQSVQKGDLLLSFTDNAGVYRALTERLTRLRYEKQKYENALEAERRGLQLQMETLGASLESLQASYKKAPKSQKPSLERSMAQLRLQMDTAERELALLEEYGIVDGTGPEAADTEPILQIEQCLASFDRERGLVAPRAALVASVLARPGSEASGAMLTLIEEPEEATLTLVTREFLSGQAELQNVACSLHLTEGEIQGVLLGCQTVSAGTALTIELPGGARPLGAVGENGTSVRVTVGSPYYEIIVPNDALMGGRLFLLSEAEDFWGKRYYVRECATKALMTGRSESALQEDSVLKGATVVTAWDRALQDGDAVRPYGG